MAGYAHHRPARRLAAALLAPVPIAALVWLGMHLVAAAGTPIPVYSVAALEAHLAHDPAAWLHRPVQVRAALGGQCTAMTGQYILSCSSWRMALIDPRLQDGQSADGTIQPLPLAWDGPPAWQTFLRHLPLVGPWVSAPQILHSGITAVYRIELRPTACVRWQDTACDEALLLNAFPPDNSTDWVRIGS